ncbi:gamma-glutamyltransferase [Orbaceae bacterium ESL0721]|nr:gamma-glutamyltransferase [Orbaceae bacterium ESL0721]
MKYKLSLIMISFCFTGAVYAEVGRYPAGAVASPDQYGTKVAAEVLKNGGNAVDAAVATAFTLAVTYPEAGNIGGGGFMTIYMNGKPYFVDYREVAPKLATKDMYLDEKGDPVSDMSLIGAKAAGVPGTVMGLWEIHQKFGTLKWSDLVQPAINYAENGFTVADAQFQYRQDAVSFFGDKTNFFDYFGSLKSGANFKQPELAKTLTRIAKDGPKDFYHGETAKLLVKQMEKDGGLITSSDLANYTVKWREPLSFSWRDNIVHTAPPPSSGGVALKQLLLMKEARSDDFNNVPVNSAQYIHLLSEIEKRVFADRADYLGDPAFTDVPLAKLTDIDYINRRAKEVNPKTISPTPAVKAGLEPHQTTHFSIVDKWGNAVSNTYTLNWDFGSGVVVSGAGFLLNDEMDDFSSKPGVANQFGVIGGDANAIAPSKRMLSSMSPTIITQNGKVSMVIGTPGGSRIFTSIFQVINNVYDYHMPLQDAVNTQRVHHQLLPQDTIYYDTYKPLTGEVATELEKRGYNLENQGWKMGDIEAITINGDVIEAASDGRARGTTAIVN